MRPKTRNDENFNKKKTLQNLLAAVLEANWTKAKPECWIELTFEDWKIRLWIRLVWGKRIFTTEPNCLHRRSSKEWEQFKGKLS